MPLKQKKKKEISDMQSFPSLISRLFYEMLGNLPLLLPYKKTMRQSVVVLFHSWDISGIGRLGIKWKYNRGVVQNNVNFTPEEGCALVTKPQESYNGATSEKCLGDLIGT